MGRTSTTTMLQYGTRRLLPAFTRRSAAIRAYTTSSHSTDNPVPANDPNPKQPHTPVSSTNQLPTSSAGTHNQVLQESTEDAEEKRVMQAPNRETVWSRSQKPRSEAMVGPRFEQTIMEDQPRPYAASPLDQQAFCVLRRRRRTSWPPTYLHQRRQATDLLVHLLRCSICTHPSPQVPRESARDLLPA